MRRNCYLKACGLFVGIVGVTVAAPQPAATTHFGHKTVLFLCGERADLPAVRAVEQDLREVLHSSTDPEIEFFPEYLDFARFPDELHGDTVVRYLRDRYAGHKVNLIVAASGFALEFALAHREELFPEVPVVFCAADQREIQRTQLPPNVTGIVGHFDIERTVELIFALQPEVREIVCVGGTAGFDQRWEEEARKVLERFGSRAQTHWITDKSLQKTLDEVSRLPTTSAVLFLSMLKDGAGHSMVSLDAVRDVARVSKAPVYGLAAHFMDAGVVGGAVFDFGTNGRKAGELALKVLRGQWVSFGSPELEIQNPLVVNAPALKKWGLPESKVPPQAEVRLKTPHLWETHRGLILGVAFVVLLQAAFIAGLIMQRLQRRRAERSLRESEERMRLAADAADLGIWEWDLSKDEIWATNSRRNLLGWPTNSRIRFEDFISCVHPDDRDRIRKIIDDAVHEGTDYDADYRLLLPHGVVRWMATRGRMHFDETRKAPRLLGISIDITARKQEEFEAKQRRDDVSHLSRVALMGEMSASIAHELNQPLAGIVSNASAGQRFIDHGNVDLKEIRELLADISADGRRAGEVVRGIRGMVKKGEAQRQRMNLNDVVMHVVQMVSTDALLHSCEVRTSLQPNLPVVEADAVQVQQVLINLIVNSFDAMQNVPAAKRKVEISTQRNGNGTVETVVRDYGTGISEEASDRLFQQFFTTKKEGLGMGLAIVRSIVESHDGKISGENAEGGGARFHFTLPEAVAP